MDRRSIIYPAVAILGGLLVVSAFYIESRFIFPTAMISSGPQGFDLILFMWGAILGLACIAYWPLVCENCDTPMVVPSYLDGGRPGSRLRVCAKCKKAMSKKDSATSGKKADRDWSE